MTVNKSDTTLRITQMLIQPVTAIAVAVQVVNALVRVEPHHIGVVVGIHSETIVFFVRFHSGRGLAPAILSKRGSVLQEAVTVLMPDTVFITGTEAQAIDHLIERFLPVLL